MSVPVTIDPAVRERYPGYRVEVIVARGLVNGPSGGAEERLLHDAAARAHAALGSDAPSAHPHVAAWRAAYGAFGAKPSRYPSSVESLLKRVARGQQLPAVNRVVDRYNALSVAHATPVGGEDLDRLEGTERLVVAAGGEPWDGDEETVPAGEVVWRDDLGVTCRRWCWRQGRRTRITEATTSAVFLLERLEPWPLDALTAAGDAFVALLRDAWPEVTIERERLPY